MAKSTPELNVGAITTAVFIFVTLAEWKDTVDLEKPVVIAEIAPQRYNVIDGHHRMEKARRGGVTQLPCYRVPPEVHALFLCSQEAYDSYIDYWNEKVDEL